LRLLRRRRLVVFVGLPGLSRAALLLLLLLAVLGHHARGGGDRVVLLVLAEEVAVRLAEARVRVRGELCAHRGDHVRRNVRHEQSPACCFCSSTHELEKIQRGCVESELRELREPELRELREPRELGATGRSCASCRGRA
jgi:hypothetical protein